MQVDVLCNDFSKAFDRLDGFTLLPKFSRYGSSDNLIQLLKSYQCLRTHFVILNGYEFRDFVARTRVPQGFKLGTFSQFVDKRHENENLPVNYLLYADDLKLHSVINSQLVAQCLTPNKSMVHLQQFNLGFG